MVIDYLDNHYRNGMTREEMVQVLGGAEVPRNGEYLYFLGLRSFLGIEHPTRSGRYLYIQLKDGKTTGAELRSD